MDNGRDRQAAEGIDNESLHDADFCAGAPSQRHLGRTTLLVTLLVVYLLVLLMLLVGPGT